MRAEMAADHLSDQLPFDADRSAGDPRHFPHEMDRSAGDPRYLVDWSVIPTPKGGITDHPVRIATGRTAHLGVHKCGEPMLTGLDDDRCAFTATCDPYRLTVAGEVEALRDGRWTYQLIARGLERRTRWNIPGHPPTADLPVLAEHRCGSPVPQAWLAPPAPTPPRPTVEAF